MTETDTILGMSKEEFKETIITSAIMSGISFLTVFLGMIVRNYVQEKIS